MNFRPLICPGCREYADTPGGCACPEVEPQCSECGDELTEQNLSGVQMCCVSCWWAGAGVCQGDMDWLARLGIITQAQADALIDLPEAVLADARVIARAKLTPAEHMEALRDEELIERATEIEAAELCREAV